MHATMIPRKRGRIVKFLSVVGDDGGTEPWRGRSVSHVPDPHTLHGGRQRGPFSARHALLADEILGQNFRTAHDYSKLTWTRRTYWI